MAKLTRRDCIKGMCTTLAGAGIISALPAAAWSGVLGSNDDIRVAVIGLQHRGSQLVDAFGKIDGVRVVAVCDADSHFIEREAEKLKAQGKKVQRHVDFRRILDDKTIDAVAIATPDHWHALMTVWACQAGKDVYVEKPVSHNLWEGRRMVEAARKYGRIVQAGTQNRSDVGLKQAARFLREGKLGKIRLARAFDYPRRTSIGKVDGPQPIPGTVDYNLFMGPAPLGPLMRKTLHYDWHFVWPTGTGDCGNRGVHELDQIRWMIGQQQLPTRVTSIAGRFGYEDDAETPNTQITWFDCRPVPILWELKSLPKHQGGAEMDTFRGRRTSMIIECEQGYLTGGRGGATAFDPQGKRIDHFPGDSGVTHQANFIAAMRSRKANDLEADILECHISTGYCHAANISHLVGRKNPPERIAEAIRDNELLAESFGRMTDHLKANEVDFSKTPLTAGATLTLDVEKERFVGEAAERANMLLRRNYRRPFVVPDDV